jgi:hypothetical protein
MRGRAIRQLLRGEAVSKPRFPSTLANPPAAIPFDIFYGWSF